MCAYTFSWSLEWLQTGFWIDDPTYWNHWYGAWLHFSVHYITHSRTSVYSHGPHCRCLVTASNSERSPYSGFLNCPRPQYWIDDPTYWNHWYGAWLHLSVHYITHSRTSVYSHGLHCRCLVTASNSERSPYSGFLNCPRSQVLDWWPDLLESLIRRMTTFFSSLYYTLTH
jgi:hypothetical protein